MHKQWVGSAPQNFRSSRPLGLQPEAIVIHIAEGSVPGTIAHFQNPAAGVSAHYLVGKDGAVHQFVEEPDTAFHAGIIVNPPKPLPRPGVNPNFYTIGIEHEGRANDEWPEAMYAASAELVAEIAARWNIPLDEAHILLHREIRASKTCPGSRFERAELLARAKAAKLPGNGEPRSFVAGIEVLARTNVREGSPRTSARIVRVLPANTTVTVTAFTDQGERVQGNSHWYRLDDGNFIWAGTSSHPQPVRPAEPPIEISAPPVPLGAVPSGIGRIDNLLAGQPVQPIAEGDPDRAAVGALQDLLTGHGLTGLPGILSPVYGSFSTRTASALRDFQQRHGIPAAGRADAATLQQLVTAPASDPRATQAYLTLVLGRAFNGMTRVLSLVAQMEGIGKFGALNLNTDRAGLSFGLIQWAQRPGRLPEILNAFLKVNRGAFVGLFGDGDPDLAAALVAHTRRPSGGVDPKSGQTADPAFDLIADPWISRFRRAALDLQFQRVQIEVALAAFQRSLARIRAFAPGLKSERAIAFMLDVANQFGDAGAERLFKAAARPGLDEASLLGAVADATVDHFEDRFKAGVRARRDMFLHTPLLSDAAFQETPEGVAVGPS